MLVINLQVKGISYGTYIHKKVCLIRIERNKKETRNITVLHSMINNSIEFTFNSQIKNEIK